MPLEWSEAPRAPSVPEPDFRHIVVPEGEAPPDAVAFGFVDQTVITVGDVLTLTVVVNHALGVQVGFPTYKRMNRFEVLPGEWVESEPTPDGRIVQMRKYLLQGFLPGDYRVPPVPVMYLDKSGRKRRLRTEPIEIVVASVIPEDAEPTDVVDIKPTKNASLRFATWIVPAVIAAVVAVAGLLTFAFFWLRRRAPELKRPVEAHEIALAELEALRARGLLAEGRYQEHYVELSLIFRRYLTRRYAMAALREASEEIGRELTETPYLGEHTFEVAERFMGETDKVKFAMHDPKPPESEGTWNDIVYFVDLTRTMTPTMEAEGEVEEEGEGAAP